MYQADKNGNKSTQESQPFWRELQKFADGIEPTDREPEDAVKELVEHHPELRLWIEKGEQSSCPLIEDTDWILAYCEEVIRTPEVHDFELDLCRRYFPWWAAHWATIINKDKEIQTLTLNAPQRMYYDQTFEKDPYSMILKARKEGMSTYTLAEFYWRAIFGTFTNTMIMAHRHDSAGELWSKVDLFDQRLPDFMRPNRKKANTGELYYDLSAQGTPVEARYLVASAGSKEAGRGGDLDQVLLSEFAFYQEPQRTMAAVLEATRRNAQVRIETTANGRNFFYDEWRRGKKGRSVFTPFFLRWFDDPSNAIPLDAEEEIVCTKEEESMSNAFRWTPEQVKWRRRKTLEVRGLFGQEYPENDEDPFTLKTGKVFPGFTEQIHVIPPFTIPDDWNRYRSIDFGFVNPFCCLWICVNGDGEAFIYDEIYERGKRTEEHIPLIRAKSRGKKLLWTVCDHEADQRADLQAGGIYTNRAPKHIRIEYGLDIIRRMLSVKSNGRPSLYIFDDCAGIRNEFMNYSYPEGTGETRSEAPAKEFDHAMDALRYWAVAWTRQTGLYLAKAA